MYLEEFDNFKPKDFLKLSQKLDNMQDEFYKNKSALARTIMSRLYYAAFLYVRQWSIKHLDYKSNLNKDHRQLPNFIANKGPFSESVNLEISGYLKTLRTLRNQSDYDLKIPKKGSKEYGKWEFKDTKNAFELANEIFNSFEKL